MKHFCIISLNAFILTWICTFQDIYVYSPSYVAYRTIIVIATMASRITTTVSPISRLLQRGFFFGFGAFISVISIWLSDLPITQCLKRKREKSLENAESWVLKWAPQLPISLLSNQDASWVNFQTGTKLSVTRPGSGGTQMCAHMHTYHVPGDTAELCLVQRGHRAEKEGQQTKAAFKTRRAI